MAGELREGVEGLIPKEEMDEAASKLKAGETIKCEVTSQDTVDRRLFLSAKNIGAERPAQPQRKYASVEAPAGTLGDLIKEKLGGKLDLK